MDAPTQNLHNYQNPLIIEPTGQHKSSFIVLHGRGDQGRTFAQGFSGFLQILLPDGRTIQEHLPNTRFVFPSAKQLKSKRHRAWLPQWFDCDGWRSSENADWEHDGLKETTEWIHELMRREIAAVGAKNVVLGGLSQGCASSLIALLLWEGEPIRSMIGMSGWLPQRHIIETGISAAEGIEATDGVQADSFPSVIQTLCQAIGYQAVGSSPAKSIPVMLLHGGTDHTVPIEHGRGARDILIKLGLNVTWKEYPDLVHWMRDDELQDIVDFVDVER